MRAPSGTESQVKIAVIDHCIEVLEDQKKSRYIRVKDVRDIVADRTGMNPKSARLSVGTFCTNSVFLSKWSRSNSNAVYEIDEEKFREVYDSRKS